MPIPFLIVIRSLQGYCLEKENGLSKHSQSRHEFWCFSIQNFAENQFQMRVFWFASLVSCSAPSVIDVQSCIAVELLTGWFSSSKGSSTVWLSQMIQQGCQLSKHKNGHTFLQNSPFFKIQNVLWPAEWCYFSVESNLPYYELLIVYIGCKIIHVLTHQDYD